MSIANFLCTDMPDDYQVHPCVGTSLSNDCLSEIAGLNAMHELGRMDDSTYCQASLGRLAFDYLLAADELREQFHQKLKYRDEKLYSYNPHFFIPCAFLCRHCLELKIKELIYRLSPDNQLVAGHDLQKLWDKLISINSHPTFQKIQPVIADIAELDDDGMKLRYSFDKNGNAYDGKSYFFNIDILVDNTKYFYKVAEEIIRNPDIK